MTHKIPTGHFRGTERADQTDDPTLPRGERGIEGGGPTPAPPPLPWLIPALVLAGVLVITIVVVLAGGLATR